MGDAQALSRMTKPTPRELLRALPPAEQRRRNAELALRAQETAAAAAAGTDESLESHNATNETAAEVEAEEDMSAIDVGGNSGNDAYGHGNGNDDDVEEEEVFQGGDGNGDDQDIGGDTEVGDGGVDSQSGAGGALSPSALASGYPQYYVVVAGPLHLHSSPGLGGRIVHELANGEIIKVSSAPVFQGC